MSFLAKVGAVKRQELARLRASAPPEGGPPIRSFSLALQQYSLTAIAEIKRRSPSRGELRSGADAVEIARAYEDAGAAALSVLTDATFFGGSGEDLRRVREAVGIPILRKDFLIDPLQVAEARSWGADAVLLIAAMLDAATLSQLLATTHALGMEALVEVHEADELALAVACGARIVGVNNRDLDSLTIDLAVAEALLPRVPAGLVRVAESGIGSPADCARMRAAGADAVLVGTSLMQAPDPGEALRRLMTPCG